MGNFCPKLGGGVTQYGEDESKVVAGVTVKNESQDSEKNESQGCEKNESQGCEKNESQDGCDGCDCTIVEEFQTQIFGMLTWNFFWQRHDIYTGTVVAKNITCLGIAILRNKTAAVKNSLVKGCNVNSKTTIISGSSMFERSDGFTPLMMAARYSKPSVVSLLIAHHGIEIDKRNDNGETALSMAVKNPNSLDIVKLLVENGAKIDLRDRKGNSPLHWAVEFGAIEAVKYLHSVGASIHTCARHHVTPLCIAVSNHNTSIAKYLIQNGASFHYPRNSLWLAKEEANIFREIIKCMEEVEAESTKEEVVKTCDCSIVEEFQMCDGPKYKNLSCLEIAILENNIEAVETSLEKGCDVNFDKAAINRVNRYGERDVKGWMPLKLACEHSSLPIVSLLVGHPDIVIDKTLYYVCSIGEDENALNRAVRRDNNLDMVKLLVEAGADPDMRSCNGMNHQSFDGMSHLHVAAYCQQLDIVKYLQSKGAWVDTKEIRNTTPLWLAAYFGNLEMVKFLVGEGATLDSPSAWYGYYPLNIAVAEAHVEVVKYLIEQGADVNKESEGQNCDERKEEKSKFMEYFPTGHYKGCRDDATYSSLEIAQERMESSTAEPEKIPLYQEIIRILKEAGAKEVDYEVVSQMVLDTMDIIMVACPEKDEKHSSGVRKSHLPLPQCIKKLRSVTRDNELWLQMVQALLEVIPIEHPMGPIVIAILIKKCPMPVHFNPTNIDTYLKVLEMASSFDSNDSRHGNMSVILSCIAGDVRRYLSTSEAVEVSELLLTPAMFDYLFGNLKSDLAPSVVKASLLALEDLAHNENKNTEIIRKRFTELSPEDHPLLKLEKLVDSGNWEEKQIGFCSQWYLDNLYIYDLDDRVPESIDTTNINVKLIASDSASKYLKIGSNGLEVRGDAPWFDTAVSTVQVNEGCWYFEVTIVTSGFMQIGWITPNESREYLIPRKSNVFDEDKQGYGVGDDTFGQSYDGCRQVVWHNRERMCYKDEHPETSVSNGWKPGDVVGSLIDIEAQEIVFSLNGVNIAKEPYKDVFKYFKDGFVAAVSLMSFQQCQINFGRDPFKYPPEERTFKPLNDYSVMPSLQD